MEGSGVEEMMRGWREEMGEIIKGLKSMMGWKEEFRQMKEVREEIREQGRLGKKEIEQLRKEWKEQERN